MFILFIYHYISSLLFYRLANNKKWSKFLKTLKHIQRCEVANQYRWYPKDLRSTRANTDILIRLRNITEIVGDREKVEIGWP